MKKVLFLIFLPLFFYGSDYLSSLDNVYTQDKFRYFYTLKGGNALSIKNQVDENKNNIPDSVENIANQLSQSYNLFINDFGFKSPLEQEKFKNKANFIDIHFIKLDVNGAAGDVVVNNSLIIKLSTNLTPKTLTPLHEFFHLIQYGYSMFNNRWSMEGQARWAEYSFRKDVGDYSKKLPINFEELEVLFNSIYEAKDFWNRLAYLSNKNEKTFLSSKNYSFINGESFLEDNKLYGYEIIKRVLENYELFSKKAEEHYLYKKYNWTEKEQKSFNNNKFILEAMKKTLLVYDDEEIKEFIVLIDKYLIHLEFENNKNDITNDIKNIENIQIKKLNNSYKLDYLNDLIINKKVKEFEIFPSKSIYYNIPKKIIKSIEYKNGFIYIGAYNQGNTLEPFGIYYGKIENDKLITSEIKLNDNFKPLDILNDGNNTFLMVSDKTNKYNKIKIFSNLDDVNNWDFRFQFQTKFNINTFSYEYDKFIFFDIKNPIFLEAKGVK